MKIDGNDSSIKSYGQTNAVESKQSETKQTEEKKVVTETYSPNSVEPKSDKSTYKVDMKEINRMKAESDRYLLDTLKAMAKGQITKQSKAANGDLTGENSIDIEISIKIKFNPSGTVEGTQPTQETNATTLDPYWSAEATSDRMVDFAKKLSGGNPEKAELLKNAFIEGYKQAKEAFGGKLPQVSEDTYKMTIDKFDAWKKGESQPTSTPVE